MNCILDDDYQPNHSPVRLVPIGNTFFLDLRLKLEAEEGENPRRLTHRDQSLLAGPRTQLTEFLSRSEVFRQWHEVRGQHTAGLKAIEILDARADELKARRRVAVAKAEPNLGAKLVKLDNDIAGLEKERAEQVLQVEKLSDVMATLEKQVRSEFAAEMTRVFAVERQRLEDMRLALMQELAETAGPKILRLHVLTMQRADCSRAGEAFRELNALIDTTEPGNVQDVAKGEPAAAG